MKQKKNRLRIGVLTLMLLGGLGATPAAVAQNSIPDYKPAGNLSGTLSSVGSDTMVYLMSHWGVEFKRLHPEVKFRIEAAGSGTAPAALIEGLATLGPMSREMKDKEIKAFTEKFGYAPTRIRVAVDGLAVYVHKSNPIAGLTLEQLDAIFSSERLCDSPDDITSWGQLGVNGIPADKGIKLFGRDNLSGTHSFFAKTALCGGKYKATVKAESTSAQIVQSVAGYKEGIGYSGIGYLNKSVRAVPLALDSGHSFAEPNITNINSGNYPLVRHLYIYVNKAPDQPLPAMEYEFLKLVLSYSGQTMVESNGFVPLSGAKINEELSQLR